MLNYVQEQDVNFIGVKIDASENRFGVGCGLPGETPDCQLSTQESYLRPVDFQRKTINYKNS